MSNTTKRGSWTAELDREGDSHLAYAVHDYDGDLRARFFVGHDARRYVADLNAKMDDRHSRAGIETGDAKAEVAQSMRNRMDTIMDLVQIAGGDGDELDYSEYGVEPDSPMRAEQAQDALREMPLCVEATTQFEIVLGTGGPDCRLIIECEGGGVEIGSEAHAAELSISRVLYRYSWTGSAEVELIGEDREAAEALAREVVPELVDA